MLNDNIAMAFRELADEVKKILEDRIRKYGVNPKIGENTLQGSNLERSIKVNPIEYGVALQIADYWEFISRGWERTGNYPNTMAAFVRNIDDWVRRKNIRFPNKTQSQVVWSIITNIWNHGIRPRPFMVYDDEGDLTKMIPELEGYIDEWFDSLFEAIITDLNKHFE